MKVDFDRLAPEERRILLVASDDKYRDLVTQVDTKRLLGFLPLALAGGIGLVGAGAATLFLSQALGATYQGVLKGPKGDEPADLKGIVTRVITKGEIVLPHLSPQEAVTRFNFDPGDLEDGAAYLASPFNRDHYLRPAVANERLAQEKMRAFVKLAASLGAKTIVLASVDSDEKKGGAKGNVPISQLAAQIGISATFDASGSANRQVYMEFDTPRQAPFVPDDLAHWLRADPMLRSLAETRLTARTKLARATLMFGDSLDFGADAMVTLAKLAGRGVDLGGTYKRVVRSTFSFEIEFYPWD
ncbi:MAG: hypothetical protein IPK82_41340 [Polyangiaceae bacterium]|nr:hypothetical protein [Polyangiaceae bacterium]